MTDFQPTPQTPEQVDEGLRNAFRQAIKDGVMDATPYLKQMTYKSDIEKTEAEIKVLQKKLELLKEIETHKSQPRMYLENSGKYEVVSYNGENYYRLEYPTANIWYKRKDDNNGVTFLKQITDGETHRLLEGVWFNDVKKGKYDDLVEEDTTSSTLYEMFCKEQLEFVNRDVICEIVERWLPDEDDADDRYACGWNDCVEKLKLRLK
jgi:hypothetical protein